MNYCQLYIIFDAMAPNAYNGTPLTRLRLKKNFWRNNLRSPSVVETENITIEMIKFTIKNNA